MKVYQQLSSVKYSLFSKSRLSAALAPTALVIALASTLTPSTAMAAQRKIDQRWFEIEVILFSQLGDKKKLKETFGESAPLPNYKTFDLLTPYLHPDLSALKAQLPICHEQSYRASYLIQQSKLPALFEEKSLKTINEETIIEPLAINPYAQASLAVDADENIGSEHAFEQAPNQVPNQAPNQAYEQSPDQGTQQAINARRDGSSSITVSEPLVGLTPQEQTLIAEAEQSFSTIQFTYTQASKSYSQFAFSYGNRNQFKTLCSTSEYSNEHADNALLSAANAIDSAKNAVHSDSYPVNQLSGRINGREYVYTDNPYLISSDSLKLKDIYLQLRRSRNFRPLLHLGWRQSLINRKPASQTKALKIFAGEHFQQQYLDEKQQYQTKLNEVALNTWLAEQLALNSEITATGLEQSQQTQNEPSTFEQSHSPEGLKLKYIFDNIEQADLNTEQLVADVNNTKLFDALVNSTDNSTEHANQSITANGISQEITEPIVPVQPWFLDGLFRVHLSHYLYITADFNVSSLTGAELATKKLTTNNLVQAAGSQSDEQPWHSIPFSQNRRVISGEVHYFDHPYMGMIVQIRRYKKPDPIEEQEKENEL